MAGHREDGFAEIPASLAGIALAGIAHTAIFTRVEPSNAPKPGRKNTPRIALFEAIRISLFEP
jgi:hypothetical protein